MTAAPTPLITGDLLRKLGLPHALDPHPDWACPSEQELARMFPDPAEAMQFLRKRHEAIARQLHDPLRYGWESPGAKRADKALEEMRAQFPKGVLTLLIQGGNRPGKSWYCARKVMRTLTGGPKRNARCFQRTEKESIITQQEQMRNYLPPEIRPEGESKGPKSGGTTSIRYTRAAGFSNNTFVLPNGSMCDFRFYETQLEALQGGTFDIIWMDEEAPADYIADQRYRLLDRSGVMLVSFTALHGYTAAVAMFLDGAVAIEEMEAELLPVRDEQQRIVGYEKVPLVMACTRPTDRVVYFPTQENFYGPYETMKLELETAPRETKLVRAYGVASQRKGVVFTNYDDAIHILHEPGYQRMLAAAGNLTWYQVYDPAGGRNAFMQWWAVTKLGQWILMREWPQPGDYIPGIGSESGVWAVAGAAADGARGPAQESFKFGTLEYAQEIARVERSLGTPAGIGRVVPFSRYMDSRAAGTEIATSGASTTLVDLFATLHADPDTGEAMALDFEKASGRGAHSDGTNWIDFVQMKLVPDKKTGIAPLMIAHCCRNTIHSLKSWTGQDGQKGACKDPIDCLKYFALSDPTYVEPEPPRHPGQQWGGYGKR